MASTVVSSATTASINRASPAQASIVAPFSGLKSTSACPVTRELNNDINSVASNGGKVQCMKVWPPLGKKKFETLPHLPDLTPEQLAKEVDYFLRSKWIPCLEFELQANYICDFDSLLHGFVYRENLRSPGYYDGRYWTMRKLPMFGWTDSSQELKELEEAKKAYPNAFIRIIGFDNKCNASVSLPTSPQATNFNTFQG